MWLMDVTQARPLLLEHIHRCVFWDVLLPTWRTCSSKICATAAIREDVLEIWRGRARAARLRGRSPSPLDCARMGLIRADLNREDVFQKSISYSPPLRSSDLNRDDIGCWTTTPHVNKWLKSRGLNASQAYEYFVLHAQKIALSHGYEVINWEETFNNFGSKLSRKTIVHNWLGGGVAQKVVASGLRCIVSNQDKWYLDSRSSHQVPHAVFG